MKKRKRKEKVQEMQRFISSDAWAMSRYQSQLLSFVNKIYYLLRLSTYLWSTLNEFYSNRQLFSWDSVNNFQFQYKKILLATWLVSLTTILLWRGITSLLAFLNLTMDILLRNKKHLLFWFIIWIMREDCCFCLSRNSVKHFFKYHNLLYFC